MKDIAEKKRPSSSEIVVAALYQFVELPDYKARQAPLQAVCDEHGVKGTILLAPEGINGTIAGTQTGIEAVLTHLRSDPRLHSLTPKRSYTDFIPFYRMKVRLKKEIVSMGVPGVDPNRVVGTYVAPEDWNDLISEPDVLVIDTRNDFEVEVGTFKGAVNPQTDSFRQFPAYVQGQLDPQRHKKIAMFCTGGIRCEKATSFMLDQGFEEIYHLKGGILKYLEEIPPQESLWQGECFVFDNRVTVDHDLKKGSYHLCHACQQPLSEADLASPKYEEGVSCHHCYDGLTADRAARLRERQRQITLAQERGEAHIGRSFD